MRAAAEHFGYSHRDIVSGAGHDACYIARVAPTAMIFTPCVDGVSHNESEDIKPEWATAGANVLMRAVLEKAEIVRGVRVGREAHRIGHRLTLTISAAMGDPTMTTLIKNGTVVAADRTYKADVLIDGERIAAVGTGLSGDTVIDAAGCYVMPGGIDPHTHLDMPFMGTNSADDYESGTRAALSGGTTMVVDFCIPGNGQPLMDAWADWDRRSAKACTDYSYHMCITYWSDRVREDMAKVVEKGVTTFKHFMAYKGALMVNDEEMFASFQRCAELGAMPLVHAENGDVVAALQAKLLRDGVDRAGGPWLVAPAGGRGRGRQPRDHDRRPGRRAALHRAHLLDPGARGDRPRPLARPARLWRAADPAPRARRDASICNPDWDHAARRVMSPPFRDRKNQDDLWNGLRAGSLQVVATDHCAFTTEQKRFGRNDFTKIPNGTGGLEDRMPVLWTHGVNTGRLTHERVRGGDLDQHRPHPQPLSAEGRDPAGRGRRHRDLGPEGDEDDQRRDAAVGDRLQRVRGLQPHRPRPHHALARGGDVGRRQVPGQARPRQVRGAASPSPPTPRR